ncbi:MAG: 3-deoxy-7-phosphoheptulonate synthase [Terriglobales bacterium]
MLLQLRPDIDARRTAALRAHLSVLGYDSRPLSYLGPGHYALLPAAETDSVPLADPGASLRRHFGGIIARLEPLHPAGLAARARRPQGTRVQVDGVEIGAGLVIIAGPCSVESREQLLATALGVRAAGAHILRGGAYKPRTSTYDFPGLGRRGLELLAEVGAEVGLPVVTEVMAAEDVELVAQHAAMLQVGARNMQNFPLLRKLGELGRPVLLKRAPSAPLEEWLAAAEYLLARGNDQVVLCERGIRGFDRHTRNLLDLGGLAAMRLLTHLPVLADPSHATGRRALVAPGACAAVAAGADGVCVEVHVRPEESVSDREQAIAPADLAALIPRLHAIAAAVDPGRARVAAPAAAQDYCTTCREV